MAVTNGDGRGDRVLSTTEPTGGLFAFREASSYNAGKREFSGLVGGGLKRLLRGDLNRLALLRRYHQQPDRLAAPVPPHGVDRAALRIPVVEELLIRVLVFLQTGMPGGPI